MTKQIAGLTEYGMTSQTILLAQKLSNEATRKMVIAAIEAMGKPEKYSNESVDRRMYLAGLLADIMREAA